MLERNIVVVSSEWCNSCNSLKNDLTRAEIVYKVIDADNPEGMDFCRSNNVRSLPTSFIYEDGEIKKTLIGLKKVEEFL